MRTHARTKEQHEERPQMLGLLKDSETHAHRRRVQLNGSSNIERNILTEAR